MLIILRGYWLAWLIGWLITCCRPQLRLMFCLFGDAAALISHPGLILEAPLRWNRRQSASEALVVLWETAHHLSRCERNRGRGRRHRCCRCERRIKFIADLGRGSLTKQSPLALSLVARSSSAEGNLLCSHGDGSLVFNLLFQYDCTRLAPYKRAQTLAQRHKLTMRTSENNEKKRLYSGSVCWSDLLWE